MNQEKKQKYVIKIVLIVVASLLIIFIVKALIALCLVLFSMNTPSKDINGIENYDKSYYLKEYGGDLDSNLSIFPDTKDYLNDAKFLSSLQTNLFDSDGYILLISRYDENEFNNEIERLKKISATIYENCKEGADTYTNYIKYDDSAYDYPAYITIDGFGHTYEYALINSKDLEIIYVYLSYPNTDNSNYEEYLKKDKSTYKDSNTMSKFSMYNHSFDGGSVYMEIEDCGREN